ncbi:MAG: LLM class flavin-dependent oxidoreductase [Actinomycetia bacterium]|nr:LLM class flavin-dependent oxidoreductase [Actinomycetes bacterium]
MADPTAPTLALVQPAHQPAELMVAAAQSAEEAGLEEVWLWEDCFFASGIAPAAAILSATERLRVGIGLLPVPLRAPSLTAMEIAAIERMFPGRFLPGLGHGILDWMGQAGVRVDSPVTLLREHTDAIGRLLRGEQVSTDGRYVHLDRVQLNFPPLSPPPLYIGGRGPKTLAVAAELADGVILDDAAPDGVAEPARIREVRERLAEVRAAAGRAEHFDIAVFLSTAADISAAQLADQAGALFAAGAHRVAAFAGGVDGPPGHGQQITDFIPVLAQARQLLTS